MDLTEIEREEEKEMVVVEANGVGPHPVGISPKAEGLSQEEEAGATVIGQEETKMLGIVLMIKHQQQYQLWSQHQLWLYLQQ